MPALPAHTHGSGPPQSSETRGSQLEIRCKTDSTNGNFLHCLKNGDIFPLSTAAVPQEASHGHPMKHMDMRAPHPHQEQENPPATRLWKKAITKLFATTNQQHFQQANASNRMQRGSQSVRLRASVCPMQVGHEAPSSLLQFLLFQA